MSDKTFKTLLAAGLLFFALYVITDIGKIGVIGGAFLFIVALTRVVSDWRKGRLPWQKKKKTITYRQKKQD